MLGVLGETQQGVVTYGGPVTRKGHPAQIQGLTFESTDETVATFVPDVYAVEAARRKAQT